LDINSDIYYLTVNAIPPSKNSDKPQLSAWCNNNGGFEDYYEKVDMNIIFKRMEFFKKF
jgi:hypothetical protein